MDKFIINVASSFAIAGGILCILYRDKASEMLAKSPLTFGKPSKSTIETYKTMHLLFGILGIVLGFMGLIKTLLNL